MKKRHPKIDIDRLREIGWAQWDPICLKEILGSWKGENFEGEYDTYLLKAAGMLRNNCSKTEVVDYLFLVETQDMELEPGKNCSEIRAKLLIVVQAISDDPLIWREPKN